jgi:hypothetical protein
MLCAAAFNAVLLVEYQINKLMPQVIPNLVQQICAHRLYV